MRGCARGWIGRWLVGLSVGLGFALPVYGQTPAVPSDKLAWTQATSGASASQLSYAAFVDGVRVAIPTATCTAGSAAGTLECQAPLPAMTPGAHSIELIAIFSDGTTAVESPKSVPLAVLVVVVTPPTNLRITR